ncbi:GGDEF domain-containing protein [Aquibacillus koreensis]|uniref:GGDEF domain-containing protein n=1 Tax=Aquibacillus koreensis TaxID=279446 RepID=A0A9X3WQX8_9BACI|nr:GGDEF domain-containing protein [Aquibacillus koreensis]MCT2537878.1 GGDEF domain-containing protein [Aquibacillus koreensis]MDC3422646.1 GGDEF domain-containing protein [Aquibacillus koreensis]
MEKLIGEIMEQVPTIDDNHTNQYADQLFKDNPSCEGIVVVRDGIPIALITRINFYQKLGTLYGYNLFMGKSIRLLMDADILCVSSITPIIKVCQLAMKRENDKLYDYVVVTNNYTYVGVVSIRNLLLTFAEVQAEAASNLNPLTGLPGNQIIDQKLKEIRWQPCFSVLYIDLDHFKSYNDLYGFSKGDQVIQLTANLLHSYTNHPNAFLGHIGGDDFIVVLDNYDYYPICEAIISEFDTEIKKYYTLEHLEKNYIVAENRSGHFEKIPLVSISIAVVTNQKHNFISAEEIVSKATEMKKRCKAIKHSCFFADGISC